MALYMQFAELKPITGLMLSWATYEATKMYIVDGYNVLFITRT